MTTIVYTYIAKDDAAPPCARCTALYDAGKIRGEMVQPLPEGARAPLAVDGSGPCCYDCGAADTFIKLRYVPLSQNFVDGKRSARDYQDAFEMARLAVGNERQEELRLPGIASRVRFPHIVKPNVDGDLERHHAWLAGHQIELGTKFIGNTWATFAKQYPNAGPDWDVYSCKRRLEGTPRLVLGADKRLELHLIDHDDELRDRYVYVRRWPYAPRRQKLIDQFYWRRDPW